MASPIIIPIIIVTIIGLVAYLMYRFIIYDAMCKRTVNQTLLKYNIGKTPAQIIKEYYEYKDEPISYNQIKTLERHYRQKEPEQFLAMYDAIREHERS